MLKACYKLKNCCPTSPRWVLFERHCCLQILLESPLSAYVSGKILYLKENSASKEQEILRFCSLFFLLLLFVLGRKCNKLEDSLDFSNLNPELLGNLVSIHGASVALSLPLVEEDDMAKLGYIQGSCRGRSLLEPA